MTDTRRNRRALRVAGDVLCCSRQQQGRRPRSQGGAPGSPWVTCEKKMPVGAAGANIRRVDSESGGGSERFGMSNGGYLWRSEVLAEGRAAALVTVSDNDQVDLGALQGVSLTMAHSTQALRSSCLLCQGSDSRACQCLQIIGVSRDKRDALVAPSGDGQRPVAGSATVA
jgi:hypothetical protein